MKTIINQTDSYIESVTFETVESLPDSYSITVTSQLLTAKNPDALQTRFKTIVSMDSLVQLNSSLTKITKGV
jgi:hypothetical protein